VQAAALVTGVSLTTTPSPVPQDQTFSITLLLAKTGEAAASVLDASVTGPSLTCATPPALPAAGIPASESLTWTDCGPYPNPRQVRMQGSATWVDGNQPLVQHTAGPVQGTIVVQ
jgi:hypothetical protein